MAVSSTARQSLWTRGVAASILLQMDDYKRGVGARLRALRRARNWSQEDASHAVGVTTSAWGRWERGTTSPYESNWKRISEVFGEEEARQARGTPPAPLGLGGNGNGNGARDDLAEIVAGLDEQIRLLRAEQAARDAEVLTRIEQVQRSILDLRRGPQP